MTPSVDRVTEILHATPATLRALLGDLSAGWIETREGEDGWTSFDVVGHLIHGEETDWIPRLQIILEHGEERVFDSFDRFAMFEKSAGKTLAQLLDEFERLREQNLDTLRGLDLQPDQLELRGTHPQLGTVTVGQLLATWVVHDLSHIGQIARTLARSRGQDVGPWREFLPILDR